MSPNNKIKEIIQKLGWNVISHAMFTPTKETQIYEEW